MQVSSLEVGRSEAGGIDDGSSRVTTTWASPEGDPGQLRPAGRTSRTRAAPLDTGRHAVGEEKVEVEGPQHNERRPA